MDKLAENNGLSFDFHRSILTSSEVPFKSSGAGFKIILRVTA
jgi:hypothetical protein